MAGSLSAPQDSFYPTWRWQAGESAAEQRHIQLPPDLVPGIYQVALRVHDFSAGRTLDVPGGERGLAHIGQIVVE